MQCKRANVLKHVFPKKAPGQGLFYWYTDIMRTRDLDCQEALKSVRVFARSCVRVFRRSPVRVLILSFSDSHQRLLEPYQRYCLHLSQTEGFALPIALMPRVDRGKRYSFVV